MRHLIQDIGGIKVSFIIDERLRYTYDSEPAIYRVSLLDYIESSKYMVLSSIKDMNQIEDKLLSYGYYKGKNLFDVYADIEDSYIDFYRKRIELQTFVLLIKKIWKILDQNIMIISHLVIPVWIMFLMRSLNLEENLSFFDFGCGKGAAMVMAYMSGIDKIGGVEVVKSLYEQCVINMKELGIDCNLLNEDAANCNIEEYNCFLLYNSFGGHILERVLVNMQKSFMDKRRRIYLIYGNPFGHKYVVENGFFKLYKQIRTDLYDPLFNIYRAGD